MCFQSPSVHNGILLDQWLTITMPVTHYYNASETHVIMFLYRLVYVVSSLGKMLLVYKREENNRLTKVNVSGLSNTIITISCHVYVSKRLHFKCLLLNIFD